MSAPITRSDLISRRVRGGFNRTESEQLLSDVETRHGGDNLRHALVYLGFATAAQAERYTQGVES